MLGIDWIQGVTGFVERGFNHQIAESVGRSRTTDRCVALDDKRLAAGAGDKRRRCKPAETGADHDDVVALRHRPLPPPRVDLKSLKQSAMTYLRIVIALYVLVLSRVRTENRFPLFLDAL